MFGNKMGLDFFFIVETWNGYDQPASLIPNGCFRFKKLSAEELIISYWKSTVFILFFNGKRILLLIKIGIEECSRYNSVTFKLLFRNLCFFYLLKKICIDIYEGWTEYNLPSTRINRQEYFFLLFFPIFPFLVLFNFFFVVRIIENDFDKSVATGLHPSGRPSR